MKLARYSAALFAVILVSAEWVTPLRADEGPCTSDKQELGIANCSGCTVTMGMFTPNHGDCDTNCQPGDPCKPNWAFTVSGATCAGVYVCQGPVCFSWTPVGGSPANGSVSDVLTCGTSAKWDFRCNSPTGLIFKVVTFTCGLCE